MIVEVFEPAIGDSQGDHCVELFGNYGLSWIGANMRCRKVEKNGIVNLDRRWRDDVPKTDVYLDGDACSIHDRKAWTNAAIFKIFSDRCCGRTLDVEGNTIIGNCGRTDGFEGVRYRLWIMSTVAEQDSSLACHKSQRALEEKAFPMFGYAEPVKQPFQSIEGKKNLIVGIFGS